MPKADTIPNKEFFLNYCRDEKLFALKRRFGVSENTIRKLKRGEAVRRDIIEKVARRLKTNVMNLIEPEEETWLDTSAKYFMRLKHGYFVDFDRRRGGLPKWWSETVRLQPFTDERSNICQLKFRGSITNQWGNHFEAEGWLINKQKFSLVGSCYDSKSKQRLGLDASFSSMVDNVLCGVWSGTNHLEAKQTLYRMMLSPRKLSRKKIISLSTKVGIETVFDNVSDFGF